MELSELPRPLAFVFSGGAALGSLQVGMLRAALEHGLVPDLVVGTSVGSLNGAVLAEGVDDAIDRLTAVWQQVRRHDVFPFGVTTGLRTLLGGRTHVFSPAALQSLIVATLRTATFRDLAVPLTVVATDALTGHPVALQDGALAQALLASAAIPGLFPAVRIDGTSLVDGGLAANVPIAPALTCGARSLLVFDAAGFCHRSRPPRSVVETMLFSSSILLRHQASCDVVQAAKQVPVLYVPAPCLVARSPMDFSGGAELLDLGHAMTASFLRTIVVDGPGMYGQPHEHQDGS